MIARLRPSRRRCLPGLVPLILSGSLLALALPARCDSWQNAPVGPLGFVTGLVVNPTQPDRKYVRTDVLGAYAWQTWGAWRPITDPLIVQQGIHGVESLAVDPTPGHEADVYAAAGRDVYVSHDAGTHWASTGLNVYEGPNDPWRSVGERLAFDPNGGGTLYFGSRNDGLWRRVGSAAWARVSGVPAGAAGAGISFVLFDPKSGLGTTGSKTIYVGVMGSGVWVTRDAGATWNALSGQPDSSYWPQRAVLDAGGALDVTYVQYDPARSLNENWKWPSGGGIWKYRAGGATRLPLPANQGYCAITASPTDPNTLMAAQFFFASGDKIYRTWDGGATWYAVNYPQTPTMGWVPSYAFSTGIASLTIDPGAPSQTWSTDGEGVWRTDDNRWADQYWYAWSAGIEELIFRQTLKIPGYPLLSAVEDWDGFRHPDLTKPPSGTLNNDLFEDTSCYDFCEQSPNFVVRVGGQPTSGGGVFGKYSSDGGATFKDLPSLPPGVQGAGRIAVSSGNAQHLVWVGRGSSGVFSSRDGGQSWSAARGLPAGLAYVGDDYIVSQPLASDRSRSDVFFLCAPTYYANGQWKVGEIWKSTDGGATWAFAAAGLADWYERDARAVYGMPGQLWVAVNGKGLFHLDDLKGTLTQVPQISGAAAIAFGKPAPGFANPATYLAGTVNGVTGVFRSDDATSAASPTWVRLDSDDRPIPLPGIGAMSADRELFGRVYVGTDGRGLFYNTP